MKTIKAANQKWELEFYEDKKKPGRKRVRLLHEKTIKEKLMKNA